MELHQLVEQFNASAGGTTKVAADQSSESVAALSAALQDVLSESEQGKTAAENANPVADLMKMAEELHGMDKEADIAHARVCGAAFADSAAQRWHELKLAMAQAGHINEQTSLGEALKVAAEQGYQDYYNSPKLAGEELTPDDLDMLVKIAEDGNVEAQQYLEKLSADYVEGQMQALDDIHELAATEFLKGAAEVRALIEMTS